MFHISKFSVASLVCCSILYSSNSIAVDFNPVVVTATRTPQAIDETLSAVTVITREDIERNQSQDVYEALRSVPGIDLARTGGTGNDVSVFMRGTNSDHVLVLIDGVRVASTTFGTFAFNTLDISAIERIEIIRGPKASLYGSDAIGGVIQIFTRKSSGVNASVNFGSFATRELSVGYGGGDVIQYNFSASLRDIGGYSSTNSNNPFSFDPDKDGHESQSVNMSVNAPLADNTAISYTGLYSNSESEFDVGTADTEERTSILKLEHDYNNSWHQAMQLGFYTEDILTAAFFASKVDTKRKSFDWQHDITLEKNSLLSTGINYYEEQAVNNDLVFNTLVIDEEIDNKAAYLSWQGQVDDNKFQASARYDDHSSFGSKSTGHVAWGRTFGRAKVRTSYGTAFKAPTVNDLFHPGFGGFFAGNPALQPETSDTFEIGSYHQYSKGHSLDVSIYDTNIKNLIDFTGVNSQAINVGKASVRGIELAYTLVRNIWTVQQNITLQKTLNEDTNTPLLRRPDEKMSWSVTRKTETGGNAGIELIVSSKREDSSGQLPGYGIVNLFASYPLAKNTSIRWRIENLLDKEYETVSGYNYFSVSIVSGPASLFSLSEINPGPGIADTHVEGLTLCP